MSSKSPLLNFNTLVEYQASTDFDLILTNLQFWHYMEKFGLERPRRFRTQACRVQTKDSFKEIRRYGKCAYGIEFARDGRNGVIAVLSIKLNDGDDNMWLDIKTPHLRVDDDISEILFESFREKFQLSEFENLYDLIRYATNPENVVPHSTHVVGMFPSLVSLVRAGFITRKSWVAAASSVVAAHKHIVYSARLLYNKSNTAITVERKDFVEAALNSGLVASLAASKGTKYFHIPEEASRLTVRKRLCKDALAILDKPRQWAFTS